ncbi:uncharacterized protein LOC120337901 [Styela clava]
MRSTRKYGGFHGTHLRHQAGRNRRDGKCTIAKCIGVPLFLSFYVVMGFVPAFIFGFNVGTIIFSILSLSILLISVLLDIRIYIHNKCTKNPTCLVLNRINLCCKRVNSLCPTLSSSKNSELPKLRANGTRTNPSPIGILTQIRAISYPPQPFHTGAGSLELNPRICNINAISSESTQGNEHINPKNVITGFAKPKPSKADEKHSDEKVITTSNSICTNNDPSSSRSSCRNLSSSDSNCLPSHSSIESSASNLSLDNTPSYDNLELTDVVCVDSEMSSITFQRKWLEPSLSSNEDIYTASSTPAEIVMEQEQSTSETNESSPPPYSSLED